MASPHKPNFKIKARYIFPSSIFFSPYKQTEMKEHGTWIQRHTNLTAKLHNYERRKGQLLERWQPQILNCIKTYGKLVHSVFFLTTKCIFFLLFLFYSSIRLPPIMLNPKIQLPSLKNDKTCQKST
jgi:hypothetical protein